MTRTIAAIAAALLLTGCASPAPKNRALLERSQEIVRNIEATRHCQSVPIERVEAGFGSLQNCVTYMAGVARQLDAIETATLQAEHSRRMTSYYMAMQYGALLARPAFTPTARLQTTCIDLGSGVVSCQ
jgi:PBP1b-binding outer membrane lipoprotein LpoB